MEKYTYLSWLETAGKQMKFPPDRETVLNELANHMADRREDFIKQGMSALEAGDAAAAVMGDPVEVGKTMNKLHSPVLGWIWKISRGLLLVVLIIVIWGGFQDDFTWSNVLPIPDRNWELRGCEYENMYQLEGACKETGVRSGAVEKAGVYTLTLDHGSWDVGETQQCLLLGFRLEAENLFDLNPLGFSHRLCAEDDLGNTYERQYFGANDVIVSDNAINMFENTWRTPYLHVMWRVDDTTPRQWIRFYIPDTTFDITVNRKGMVIG